MIPKILVTTTLLLALSTITTYKISEFLWGLQGKPLVKHPEAYKEIILSEALPRRKR